MRKLNKKRVAMVIAFIIFIILSILLFIKVTKDTSRAYNNCLKNNSKEICNKLLL